MSRLSTRDRRALTLGALIIGLAVLYAGAVRPYRSAVEDRRARIDAERALLAREEALLAAGTALPAALERADGMASTLRQRLLRPGSAALAEAELTAYLERAAASSRVLLQQIRALDEAVDPAAESTEDAYDVLRPVRLAVLGESDLDGIMSFLFRVETGPLLIRVDEISIEPTAAEASGREGGGGGLDEVVSMAMILEAYAPRTGGVEPAMGRDEQ